MLREQFFAGALKAMSKAYEVKERLQQRIKDPNFQLYLKGLKDMAELVLKEKVKRAKFFMEKQILSSFNSPKVATAGFAAPSSHERNPSKNGQTFKKSSIRKAQEIHSEKAGHVLSVMSQNGIEPLSKEASLLGKKSLAATIWALGQANQANVKEGMTIHDISSLLYQCARIELYPINISRMLHGHAIYFQETDSDPKTRRYSLSQEGQALFDKNYPL